MNYNLNDNPSNRKHYSSTRVTFKTLITQRQDQMTLRHMEKTRYGSHSRSKELINCMLDK